MVDRKTRVLGQMLGQYVGKNVLVIGSITKVGSGGKTIELTTTDNVKVNITVAELPESHETTDWFEVGGTVKSKGTMVATQCVLFKEEDSLDFDVKTYNDMISMQRAISNRLWKLNDSRNALLS